MTLTSDHKEHLYQRLLEGDYAAGYLSACAAEGREALLIGLRHVAEALGGIGQLAKDTELNRETLYRMLSENGNPTLESVLLVLDSLGIDMQFGVGVLSLYAGVFDRVFIVQPRVLGPVAEIYIVVICRAVVQLQLEVASLGVIQSIPE